jgi:hypothetical protein
MTLFRETHCCLKHQVLCDHDNLLRVVQDQPSIVCHDLIDHAYDGRDRPVMAVVTDDIRVKQVHLYYRVARTSAYVFLPMGATANGAYTAVIPASAVTALGLEYYIIARDSKGNLTPVGSATAPNFVVVQPRTLTTP